MKKWQKIGSLIGVLSVETIIMLYTVPKANTNEINMQLWLVIDLSLALLVSLAVLIKENRGKRKSIVQLFLICAATYSQVVYCSLFYKWSVAVCLILPILQIVFGYAIFKLSHNIASLLVCCSNLLFSTIWANQMYGFLWFHNKSADLETMGVASMCAATGAMLVLVMSSIMIIQFIPKILNDNETDR